MEQIRQLLQSSSSWLIDEELVWLEVVEMRGGGEGGEGRGISLE